MSGSDLKSGFFTQNFGIKSKQSYSNFSSNTLI